MSDRLKDLQRQRALAQEQLAWIDREIAKEGGQAPVTPPPAVITPAAVAPGPTDASRLAEEILAQYQHPSQSTEKDVKRGCYLYFFLALGALVLFVVGGYYLYRNFRG